MIAARRRFLPLPTFLALAVCALDTSAQNTKQTPTDADIRQLLVRASLALYESACPCPESLNRSGERCGKSSAYNRGGGNRVLCYASDVSDEMVKRYRELLAKP